MPKDDLCNPNSLTQRYYDSVADRFSARDWVTSDGIRDSVFGSWDPAPRARVLEIGIGTGEFLHGRLSSDHTHVGLDISRRMLEKCRNHLPYVDLVQGDAESIPLKDSTMDIVAGRKVLRLCSLDPALQEIWRVLKPGGLFFLVETCAANEAEKALIDEMIAISEPHQRPFHTSSELLAACEAAGFQIREGRTFAESRLLTRSYCIDHYGMSPTNVDRYWEFLGSVPEDLRALKQMRVIDADNIELQITWIVIAAFSIKP